MISMWTLISVCQGTKCPHQVTSPSPSIQQRSVSIAQLWTFPKNVNNPDTQSFDLLLLLIKFMVALGPCERRMRKRERESLFYLLDSWLTELQLYWGFAIQALLVSFSCKSTVDMMVMSSARATS